MAWPASGFSCRDVPALFLRPMATDFKDIPKCGQFKPRQITGDRRVRMVLNKIDPPEFGPARLRRATGMACSTLSNSYSRNQNPRERLRWRVGGVRAGRRATLPRWHAKVMQGTPSSTRAADCGEYRRAVFRPLRRHGRTRQSSSARSNEASEPMSGRRFIARRLSRQVSRTWRD